MKNVLPHKSTLFTTNCIDNVVPSLWYSKPTRFDHVFSSITTHFFLSVMQRYNCLKVKSNLINKSGIMPSFFQIQFNSTFFYVYHTFFNPCNIITKLLHCRYPQLNQDGVIRCGRNKNVTRKKVWSCHGWIEDVKFISTCQWTSTQARVEHKPKLVSRISLFIQDINHVCIPEGVGRARLA